LLSPDVDDSFDVRCLHSRQRQAVIRRKTNHATDASLAPRDHQVIYIYLACRHIRLQRREIVIENERSFVIGICMITGALVTGTEITCWVVLRQNFGVGLFLLTLPRPLCTVRRDDQPLAR